MTNANEYEGDGVSKTLISRALLELSAAVEQAKREHSSGSDIRYIIPLIEGVASMLRRHMRCRNERLDRMRHNLTRSDPFYDEGMRRLNDAGFAINNGTASPAWLHAWDEDDFDEDEDEDAQDTAAKVDNPRLCELFRQEQRSAQGRS